MYVIAVFFMIDVMMVNHIVHWAIKLISIISCINIVVIDDIAYEERPW